jgi:xanthine dehydrogenase YagS FAD-binding subunit
MIVAVRLPPRRRLRGACPLPESSRAHLLRLRGRVGRRRAADRERHTIVEARLALGGVAHETLARPEAEGALAGRNADDARFSHRAAEAALADAKPSGDNASRSSSRDGSWCGLSTLAAAGTPERMPALPASPFASVSGDVIHA